MYKVLIKTFKFSLIYGIATIILSASGFFVLPIYTRYISPSEYGVFSIIGIAATLLIFLCDFGMVNAVVRWYFEYSEKDVDRRRTVFSTALFFFILLAGIITIPVLIFSRELSIFLFGNSQYWNLIFLVSIINFFTVLTWIPLSIFRLKEKTLNYLFFSIIKTVFMIGAAFLFLSVFKRGLLGAFEANLCVFLFFAVLLMLFTFKEYNFKFSKKDFKGMLKFAVPFFPVLIFIWVIDFSDRYFLGRFSTLEATGLYSVGYKFGQIVFLAAKAFLIGWTPIMFSITKRQDYKKVFGRIFSYYFASIAFLALIISLFGKELVAIFTTPTYLDAYKVIPLICLSYLFYACYIYGLSGLIILKDLFTQPLILFAGGTINIIFNIIFIPHFHMMGAAYATLISYFFVAITTFLIAQRRYPINIEISNIVKVFVLSIGFFLLLNILDVLKGQAGIQIIIKIISLFLFPFFLYILGFFKKEELSYARSYFLKKLAKL